MYGVQIKLSLTVLDNIKATLDIMSGQARAAWQKLNQADSMSPIVSSCTEVIMGHPVTVKVTRSGRTSDHCKATFYLNSKRVPRSALPMEILKLTDVFNET